MPDYRQGAWYIDFVVKGHRTVERTHITANTAAGRLKAERIQAERKTEVRIKITKIESQNIRDKRGKITDQPIHDAFSAYWENHAKHAKGAADIFRNLCYAEKHLGPETPTSHIDTEAMIGLREVRRRDRSARAKINPGVISPRTVNITLEAVKFALAWLDANGREVSKVNWRVVMLEVEDRVTGFTAAHEALVIEKFRPDMLACLKFMLLCGPRKAQAVALKWSDVNFDNGHIRLIKQKKRGAKRNHKEHLVPITREIAKLLVAQRDPATGLPYHPEYVWTYVGTRTRIENRSGREIVAGKRYPITIEGLTSRWVRFKAEHGLKDVRLHDMRHYAGTRIFRLTKNPLVVKDTLGHSNLATTERYMHLSVEDVREALDRLAPDVAEAA